MEAHTRCAGVGARIDAPPGEPYILEPRRASLEHEVCQHAGGRLRCRKAVAGEIAVRRWRTDSRTQ